MLELIILSLSSTINMLLAFVVLTNRPRTLTNKYFSCFSLAFITWTIVNYLSLHPVFLSQLTWARLVLFCGALLSTFLLLFVLAFPDGKLRKLLAVGVIGGGVIAAIAAVTPWVAVGLQNDALIVGPAIPIFGIPAIGYIILSVVLLIYKSLTGNPIQRRQSRLAALALSTVFIFIAIFNFVFPSVFHNNSLLFLAPFYGIILSIGFTYGILRYRLFDLKVFAARALAYILSLGVIVLIFGLIAFGLASQFFDAQQTTTTQRVLYLVLAIIFAVSFAPIKRFFDRITNAIFFRNEYDPQAALDKLGNIVTNSVDILSVTNGALKILHDTLKADFIQIVAVNDLGDISLERHTGNVAGKDLSKLIELLADSHQNLLVADVITTHSKMETEMIRHNVAVAAKLQTSRTSIGYLFLGFKQSGQVYTRSDEAFIAVVIDELAVAMQNALRFQEIQDFNETLQQKVDEATAELKESNKKLHVLDIAKDEFISMASHQLRTPLTTVKGYLSMVLEGDSGKINPEQRKLLEEAYAGSQRMNYLIGDFLNVSRLQTGKFVLERTKVNLPKLVTEEIEQLITTAKARHLKIMYDQPEAFPPLNIDENKIRQVVMNLVDNAIFYSKPDSVIAIELLDLGKDITFKVKDSGIGVPANERHRLFSKFYRATNARKVRPDGTGIGLFMAKKVILAHGGSIIFETMEGKGSTFGFRLPIKDSNKDINQLEKQVTDD